eukprot:COSAG02_NODE_41076_length_398_cov_1.040134_1_plen_132_part_11
MQTVVRSLDQMSHTKYRRQAMQDVINDIASRPNAWFSAEVLQYGRANASTAMYAEPRDNLSLVQGSSFHGLRRDQWRTYLDKMKPCLNASTIEDLQIRADREEPTDTYVNHDADRGREDDETFKEGYARRRA